MAGSTAGAADLDRVAASSSRPARAAPPDPAVVAEHAVHRVRGGLRDSPESSTSTRRRARPSISAALSPAGPAPTTMRSKACRPASRVTGPRCGNLLCRNGKHPNDIVRARLKAIRVERGLTQEEVAEQAGMATSTLSRLESGARRLALDHLTPLAAALDVEVGELRALGRSRATRASTSARGPSRASACTRSPARPPAGMRVVRMEIPAERTVPDTRSHEGHEWLYVLAGPRPARARRRRALARAGRGGGVLHLDTALDGGGRRARGGARHLGGAGRARAPARATVIYIAQGGAPARAAATASAQAAGVDRIAQRGHQQLQVGEVGAEVTIRGPVVSRILKR